MFRFHPLLNMPLSASLFLSCEYLYLAIPLRIREYSSLSVEYYTYSIQMWTGLNFGIPQMPNTRNASSLLLSIRTLDKCLLIRLFVNLFTYTFFNSLHIFCCRPSYKLCVFSSISLNSISVWMLLLTNSYVYSDTLLSFERTRSHAHHKHQLTLLLNQMHLACSINKFKGTRKKAIIQIRFVVRHSMAKWENGMEFN